jgi:hypothetical protein
MLDVELHDPLSEGWGKNVRITDKRYQALICIEVQ